MLMIVKTHDAEGRARQRSQPARERIRLRAASTISWIPIRESSFLGRLASSPMFYPHHHGAVAAFEELSADFKI
ncbi:hypothetical protein ATC03_12075 [Agromyces aureus]|uniref:Uncharacterized protein n=1 Tax=Agromyces aureus TaxID=453304 RepID=A0A191WGC6_9MICO|nr:hypothetical protein ATC03_12075 [Agromyces aureus]